MLFHRFQNDGRPCRPLFSSRAVPPACPGREQGQEVGGETTYITSGARLHDKAHAQTSTLHLHA